MNQWVNSKYQAPLHDANIWATDGPGKKIRAAIYTNSVAGSGFPGMIFMDGTPPWCHDVNIFFWQPRQVVPQPAPLPEPLSPDELAAALQKLKDAEEPYKGSPEEMFELLCDHLNSTGYGAAAKVLACMKYYYD